MDRRTCACEHGCVWTGMAVNCRTKRRQITIQGQGIARRWPFGKTIKIEDRRRRIGIIFIWCWRGGGLLAIILMADWCVGWSPIASLRVREWGYSDRSVRLYQCLDLDRQDFVHHILTHDLAVNLCCACCVYNIIENKHAMFGVVEAQIIRNISRRVASSARGSLEFLQRIAGGEIEGRERQWVWWAGANNREC